MAKEKLTLSDGANGESFVWFTSMGLTLGLLMVVFLVGLIVVNGIAVFWPHRVTQVTMKENSQDLINGSRIFAGSIVKQQQKSTSATKGGGQTEWQFFIGNKDQYGQTFKFVDSGDIVKFEQPRNLMVMERMEYGNAIGVPQALELKGQNLLPASDPQFEPRLNDILHDVSQRRSEIRNIEKFRIGAINHEMEELNVRQRELLKTGKKGPDFDNQLQLIQSRLEVLQADYELLADRARDLREKQQQDLFTLHDSDVRKFKLPTGQIVSFYYPNRVGAGRAPEVVFSPALDVCER